MHKLPRCPAAIRVAAVVGLVLVMAVISGLLDGLFVPVIDVTQHLWSNDLRNVEPCVLGLVAASTVSTWVLALLLLSQARHLEHHLRERSSASETAR